MTLSYIASNAAPLEAPAVAAADDFGDDGNVLSANDGLGSGYGLLPLGLTGKDGEGLGGSRGGPEFLLDSGGGTLGRGGGGFLGGDLGTNFPCVSRGNKNKL